MIDWIAVAFLVVCFVVLVRIFGLVEKSKEAASIARRSVRAIRSTKLDDNEKEAALQSYAKKLFGISFILSFGGAAAVLLPMGLVWIADWLGYISLESVIDITLSPAFLITSSVFAVAVLYLCHRRNSDTTSYSFIDRLLHRVAFNTYVAQVPLANVESFMFAKRLAPYKVDRPVFITALPRTGTTLLLECFAGMPEFASHSYRDMPFVLTPCLWSRFSSSFRLDSESRERAHGDGMLINVNSHEALEEVLWKTFWRQHYLSDRIIPWQNEEHDEFQEFFSSHMRKIVLLRRGNEKDAQQARYLSKNNLNIARIRMLYQYFPGSVIIVPFREPLHHTASLLKQHCNFLRIHRNDPFASEYMRAIGHYDFGQNLCPVDFDGWFDKRVSKNTADLTFWLEYWLASYRHLLMEHSDIVHFFDYKAFCENPAPGLHMLADATGIRDPDALLSAATGIHRARTWEVDTGTVPLSILSEANDLYYRLRQVALN
jgi:hypothetical protein